MKLIVKDYKIKDNIHCRLLKRIILKINKKFLKDIIMGSIRHTMLQLKDFILTINQNFNRVKSKWIF